MGFVRERARLFDLRVDLSQLDLRQALALFDGLPFLDLNRFDDAGHFE